MTPDDYWQIDKLKWLKWTLKKWPGTQPSPRWSKSSLLFKLALHRNRFTSSGFRVSWRAKLWPKGPNMDETSRNSTGSNQTRHWNLHPRRPTWNRIQIPFSSLFLGKDAKRNQQTTSSRSSSLRDENLFPHLSPAAPFPGRVAPAPHPIRPRASWNPCAPGRWNGGMEEWWIKWSNDRFVSAISPWLRFDDRKFGSWVERDISTCLLHAVLFWDDALAKGCHLWTCGQTWRTSHSGRTV